MNCTLKDSNLKVRALRRARKVERSITLLSIFLALFRICGTFDYYTIFEYNFSINSKEVAICRIRSIT